MTGGQPEPAGHLQRAAAEGIGTFMLVFIGPGAVMVDAWSGGALGVTGIGIAFGAVVAAMIFALGHLSGAHINPAVTAGFWAAGRLPGRDVPRYVAAQLTGAVVASMLLGFIMGNVGAMGATLPNLGVLRSFAVEWVLSFALMLVIMAVATDDRVASGFAAIAVGGAVLFCALTGPLTGASMNPARSFGPAIAGGGWTGHWIYWLAPLSAMVVAARCYEWLRVASGPRQLNSQPQI